MKKSQILRIINEHQFNANNEIKTFLFDVGFLVSLGMSHITKYANNEESEIKLKEMMDFINKQPLLNGMTYFDIIKNIDKLDGRHLQVVLLQSIKLLNYIEPRILRYVRDTSNMERDSKHVWLDRIRFLKDKALDII